MFVVWFLWCFVCVFCSQSLVIRCLLLWLSAGKGKGGAQGACDFGTQGLSAKTSVKPSWLFSEAHTSIRASRQATAKKAAAKKEDGNGNVATVTTCGFSTCSCGFCGYLCFHVEFFPGHSEFSLPGSRWQAWTCGGGAALCNCPSLSYFRHSRSPLDFVGFHKARLKDDGTGGEWEQSTGLSKQAQKRKEKQEQIKKEQEHCSKHCCFSYWFSMLSPRQAQLNTSVWRRRKSRNRRWSLVWRANNW